jgi:hypothetical protein
LLTRTWRLSGTEGSSMNLSNASSAQTLRDHFAPYYDEVVRPSSDESSFCGSLYRLISAV